MTAPIHINRHVESIESIDMGSDEAEILSKIEHTLTNGGIPRAIVMPSQGIIHLIRTAFCYSEDQRHMPEAFARALRSLGFFTGEGESVPKELITPVAGAHPQYLVEITLHPKRVTLYHLMK